MRNRTGKTENGAAEAPFEKNDGLEAEIVDFGAEGEGVAKVSGVPVFIPGAIPGERVRAKITAVKKSHAFAVLESVLSASADRAEPPCPFYKKCGGCNLQHISYARQLSYKRAHIVQTVQKIAGITLELSEVIPSESVYRYRNKLSLPVRAGKNGETQIGFFRRRSHDAVDISDCLLQSGGSSGALIAGLKAFMTANGLTPYSEETKNGAVKHLTHRVLDGFHTVTVVGSSANADPIRPFRKVLQKIYGDRFALWYNFNPSDNNVIYGKSFTRLFGADEPQTVDGLLTRVHPAGFFQVNDAVRKRLYDYALEKAGSGPDGVAIEAYAGQGMLAARLAPRFKAVYAAEIAKESVDAGNEMKALNGIQNLTFIQGDCAETLERLLKKENAARSKITLLLDPPRAGLEPRVTDAINRYLPETVVYISCSPATLARDLEKLKTGYAVANCAAFDMFPQTANVETAVILKKE